MILTSFFYLLLSLVISLLISFLVQKRILKITFFSLTFAFFNTFWFKTPGESFLAPVFSIFFLESLILESNGYLRILRPFILFFLLTFITTFFLWKKKNKN
jgi:hypothetical protein